MDRSQVGTQVGSHDPEWDSRLERAASADVRRVLRTARRLRRERWLVSSVVLVAMALTMMLLVRVGLFGTAAPSSAAPAPGPGAPGEPAAFVLDPDHPFAGTPAADWADGVAGIVLPEAKAVGGYSAVRVGTALHEVRDLIVASRLDRRLVVDHDPERFLAALAPDARKQLEPLFGTGREAEVQSLVSMVAADARLLPVEPKVNGRMSVHAGGEGELVVRTNYVFVYAFGTDRPERIVDRMDILVVVRADVDYVLRTGDRWARGSQGWWYDRTAGYAYSIACDAYRKGFLAPAVTEHAETQVPGHDRGTYFDPESALPATNGCPA